MKTTPLITSEASPMGRACGWLAAVALLCGLAAHSAGAAVLYSDTFNSDAPGGGSIPVGWTDYTGEWWTRVTATDGVGGSQGLRVTQAFNPGPGTNGRGVALTSASTSSFGADYRLEVDVRPSSINGSDMPIVNFRFDPAATSYAKLWVSPDNVALGTTALVYQEVISGVAGTDVVLGTLAPGLNLWDGAYRHWTITAQGQNISVDIGNGAYATTVPTGSVTLFGGNYTVALSDSSYDNVDYDNVLVSSIPEPSAALLVMGGLGLLLRRARRPQGRGR